MGVYFSSNCPYYNVIPLTFLNSKFNIQRFMFLLTFTDWYLSFPYSIVTGDVVISIQFVTMVAGIYCPRTVTVSFHVNSSIFRGSKFCTWNCCECVCVWIDDNTIIMLCSELSTSFINSRLQTGIFPFHIP